MGQTNIKVWCIEGLEMKTDKKFSLIVYDWDMNYRKAKEIAERETEYPMEVRFVELRRNW